MPEIKHTFQGGKMNKDLDERLVPNGEYRDAMNIQVRTTDAEEGSGSKGDAGTVQNIQGNKLIPDFDTTTTAYNETGYSTSNTTTIVASIANEKNNTAYFFVAGPEPGKSDWQYITGEKLWIDSIIEIDTGTGVSTPNASPVVVDKWAVTDTKLGVFGSVDPPTGAFQQLEVTDGSKYRIGMTVQALNSSGAPMLNGNPEIQNIQGNILTLYDEQTQGINWGLCVGFRFIAPRVLNFNPNFKITGVNIIDDLLFWTDNTSEPKKINIKRCKNGTTSYTSHTQLKLKDPLDNDDLVDYIDDLEVSLSPSINNDLREEHLTVKRKAPTMAPNLSMSESDREGQTEFTGVTGGSVVDGNWVVADALNFMAIEEFGPGTSTSVADIIFNGVENGTYQINDILIFTEETGATNAPIIKATISLVVNTDGIVELFFTVISVTGSLVAPNDIPGSGSWTVELERRKPLFELKFGRFGYRYKYDDGEYSSFSPWSELAFLPGHFDYSHKKGYNLGMVNNLRELIIKDFIPHQRTRNADVVAVDILYKTTVSPNVYVVKTLTRGMDPEWDLFTPNPNINSNMVFGELNITSEMIHKVVEKNQLLRAWDNVPRFALAQEIAANRIIYSNYVQGYDIEDSVKLTQNHIPSPPNTEPTIENPQKSIKSIRDYRFGMVFGDKYGRETPVISPGYITGDSEDSYTLLSGDTTIEKQFASMKNTFELKQEWNNPLNSSGTPENWMEYVKYYVKETSNEYYNLIMDRWYGAEDGNIWLSFVSADRNKVDEETYLVLKNEHGNNIPVLEKARYKIIAIKNEAPDDIKLDIRPMGKVLIPAENYGADDNDNFGVFLQNTTDPNVANSLNPVLLMGPNKSMRIDSGTWDNFLSGYQIGLSKGKLEVRVVGINGGVVFSGRKWVTVTYHTVTGDGDGIVRWQEEFGEDADMKDRFEAAGYTLTDLKYYLEFREQVVDNKAQFDGKFFVKVEKDETLESKVLKYTAITTDWDTSYSYRMGYIDTRKENPGEIGPRSTYTWFNTSTVPATSPPSGNNASGDNIAPVPSDLTSWAGNGIRNFALGCQATDGNPGYELWPNSGSIVWSKAGRTRLFWRWSYQQYNDNGYSIGNDGYYYEGGGDASGEIRYRMFIDGARAKDLRIENGLSTNVWNDGFCGNVDEPVYDANGELIEGAENVLPNKYYKPTGIDHGYIEYPAEEGFPQVKQTTDLGRISVSILRHHIKNSSSGTDWADDEEDFKNNMMQRGTLFNFPADPNGVIYQVVSRFQDVDTWNFARNHSSIRTVVFRPFNDVGGWCLVDCYPDYYSYPNGEQMANNEHELWDENQAASGSIIKSFSGDTGDELLPNSRVSGNAKDCWNTGGSTATTSFQYLAGGNNSNCGSNLTAGGVWPFSGPNDKCFNCSDGVIWDDNGLEVQGGGDDFCERMGFRVEFRRFDMETGMLAVDDSGDTGALGVDTSAWDPRGEVCHDGREMIRIDILQKTTSTDVDTYIPTHNAACWETEPKEDVGLDLYYEASNAIPMVLTSENTIDFAPYNSKVTLKDGFLNNQSMSTAYIDHHVFSIGYTENTSIIGVKSTDVATGIVDFHSLLVEMFIGQHLVFTHKDGTRTLSEITRFMTPLNEDGTVMNLVAMQNIDNMSEIIFEESEDQTQGRGFYEIESDVYKYPVELAWFNCYSFGNGVESDRIRDDYNAPMIDNGVKLSTTFLQYGKETKGSGMIYSGLYNSISGVNNLNEFNQAEKITKDINPSYGSIQALKTRDTDIVVLTEDKILKVTTNKDALYNADGNAQLLASNRVLGTAVPFGGDYGISNNPESLAWDQYRLYFTDMQRGAVLRLSMDGLTPISNVGMKTWFRDNLRKTDSLLGTFDVVNGEYNLTLDYNSNDDNTTVSFNEGSKGWVSFKSFIPQEGVSVGGKYLTGKNASIWEHYKDIKDEDSTSQTFGQVINRNTFYGTGDYYFTESHINVMFNDMPGSVKSFRTINYEGSQAKVEQFVDSNDFNATSPDGTPFIGFSDGEYYNLNPEKGWWVDEITTDLSAKGSVFEFKDKEGKWFNRIDGDTRDRIEAQDDWKYNLNEFSVQGLGEVISTDATVETITIQIMGDMTDDDDD